MNESEKPLFLTTSDLLKRINASLDEEHSKESSDVTESIGDLKPKFELQKRLPDGSTMKADEQDMEVADLQSKIKQVTIILMSLDLNNVCFTFEKVHLKNISSSICSVLNWLLLYHLLRNLIGPTNKDTKEIKPTLLEIIRMQLIFT